MTWFKFAKLVKRCWISCQIEPNGLGVWTTGSGQAWTWAESMLTFLPSSSDLGPRATDQVLSTVSNGQAQHRVRVYELYALPD